MGIEPTTTGTTIRGSTTELHPPSFVGGELRRCAGLYTQDCGMQDKFKFSHVFFSFWYGNVGFIVKKRELKT